MSLYSTTAVYRAFMNGGGGGWCVFGAWVCSRVNNRVCRYVGGELVSSCVSEYVVEWLSVRVWVHGLISCFVD
jgi:hypothetical protein